MRLGMIVEGHGDSLALPTLVTRIATDSFNRHDLILPRVPLRVKRGRFASNFDDFSRGLQLLAPQVEAILVVLDSDDDDPAELSAELKTRSLAVIAHRPVRVVPAVREYEAWFLASVPEMAGLLDVPLDARFDGNPEAIRGAKGVFRDLLSTRRYAETIDQKKYSAVLDISAACTRSASFARLVSAMADLLANDHPS